MATTVTHIVDPDGGAGHDYDSLSLWEAGEQGDLTGARDEIAVAKCRCTGGTADTTAFTIFGWATSSANYIKIWTDPAEGYRHNGTYQTGNKYRLEITGDFNAVNTDASYIRVDGLQFYVNPSTDNTYWCFMTDYDLTTSSDVRISNCVGKSNSNGRGFFGHNDADISIVCKLWNCVAYNFNAAGWGVFYFGSSENAQTLSYTAYNCTAFNSAGRGFRRYQGALATVTATVVNCASFNCAADQCFLGTFSASDRNASSDGTAPGANSLLNRTTGDELINITGGSENLHLKSTSTLKDTGTSDPGSGLFSDDIDGQTRTGSWDIGADEYVAAVSALSISVSEALSFAEALD